MSIFLKLDSSTLTGQLAENFTVPFYPLLNLPVDYNASDSWEVALVKANLWYSWYNISAALGNNKFRYYNGSVWKVITIDDGQYAIEDINAFLQRAMMLAGDYTAGTTPTYYITMTPNYSTSKVAFTITNSYQVDLTYAGNFNSIIGYAPVVLSASTTGGTMQGDITNGINSVLLHCDLISGSSFENSVSSDILYSFTPNVRPSASIEVSPAKLIYLPVNKTTIQSIRSQVTDQRGNIIGLNNNPVTLLLHLRKSR